MTQKSDLEIIEELKQKAQKQETEELGAFNIDDFTADPEKLQQKKIPKLGIVKFKKLSYGEIRKLEQFENLEERGLQIIAAMMFKADGVSTAEKIKQLPVGIANRLLNALGPETGFL